MSVTTADKERSRKNLRTGLLLALIALASLTAFVYKVWQFA